MAMGQESMTAGLSLGARIFLETCDRHSESAADARLGRADKRQRRSAGDCDHQRGRTKDVGLGRGKRGDPAGVGKSRTGSGAFQPRKQMLEGRFHGSRPNGVPFLSARAEFQLRQIAPLPSVRRPLNLLRFALPLAPFTSCGPARNARPGSLSRSRRRIFLSQLNHVNPLL
jgi:hypothetical protein